MLRYDIFLSTRQPRRIAAGRSKAGNQATADRIDRVAHDDRDDTCCLLHCTDPVRGSHYDHVGLDLHQFSCELREPLIFSVREAVLDDEMHTLDIAELTHALQEAAPSARFNRIRAGQAGENADAPDLARLLRRRCEWPRSSAAKGRHKIAPSHAVLPAASDRAERSPKISHLVTALDHDRCGSFAIGPAGAAGRSTSGLVRKLTRIQAGARSEPSRCASSGPMQC